jgi:uncharacterized DUF497 family protein
MSLIFELDDNKAAQNFKKHSVNFDNEKFKNL